MLHIQYGLQSQIKPCSCGSEDSLAKGICPGVSQVGSIAKFIKGKWREKAVSVHNSVYCLLTSLNYFPGMTAEEITAKRRELRNQFKLDRARAIAQAAEEAEAAFAERGEIVTETSVVIPSGATWKPSSIPKDQDPGESSSTLPNVTEPSNVEPEEEEIKDIEHLQLTLQEAFFLIWTMDCLTVLDSESVRRQY